MRIGYRVVLWLLGGVMAFSALEHWMGSEALRRHYAASVLGANGLPEVAVAQTVAAVALLWPRSQVVAGCVLGAVMLVAAATHLQPGGVKPGIGLPLVIAVWAIGPAVGLWLRRRSDAVPDTAR